MYSVHITLYSVAISTKQGTVSLDLISFKLLRLR